MDTIDRENLTISFHDSLMGREVDSLRAAAVAAGRQLGRRMSGRMLALMNSALTGEPVESFSGSGSINFVNCSVIGPMQARETIRGRGFANCMSFDQYSADLMQHGGGVGMSIGSQVRRGAQIPDSLLGHYHVHGSSSNPCTEIVIDSDIRAMDSHTQNHFIPTKHIRLKDANNFFAWYEIEHQIRTNYFFGYAILIPTDDKGNYLDLNKRVYIEISNYYSQNINPLKDPEKKKMLEISRDMKQQTFLNGSVRFDI